MYLNIQELSRYLNIKTPTLYSWVGEGKVPYIKINGVLRFRREEIDGWVESFRKVSSKSNGMNMKKKCSSDFDGLFERVRCEAYNPRHGKTSP